MGSNSASSVMWPQFKISRPDPLIGEMYSGKTGLTPEQTLVEFISTSAACHRVVKQPLNTLEWELLKVFTDNVMPANAAAWYMAKRKFYQDLPLDQQLLTTVLKKFPEKFRIANGQVTFLERYEHETARQKLHYLVHYGLHAYFSHKADEYGVYFFDPSYYEHTEPFHESLRQVCPRVGQGRLVRSYFQLESTQKMFVYKQHTNLYVSICKLSSGVKVVTNVTGVIVSMINSEYGFIQFGAAEKALFCAKTLFKGGQPYTGDPLQLPAMRFDGYQLQEKLTESGSQSWFAVLVWCGRRPSPQYCATADDLNSTHVFRAGSPLGQMRIKRRQPSSSMMVGQVIEIRKEGAVVKMRDDCLDRVWVPGWKKRSSNSPRIWLSTLDGECIGQGDLVSWYVSQEVKEGFTAVGTSVTVLKECEKSERKIRRRKSSAASVGATEDEDPEREDDNDSLSDSQISEGELEWLEEDLGEIIYNEDPKNNTMDLLKFVQSKLRQVRDMKPSSRKSSRNKKVCSKDGYSQLPRTEDDFWRMKNSFLAGDTGDYHSDSDPDYLPPGEGKEDLAAAGDVADLETETGDSSFCRGSEVNWKRKERRRTLTGSSSYTDASTGYHSGSRKGKYGVPYSLPYWVRLCTLPETYDPQCGKFVPVDRNYQEEKDPDYKIPETDTESEDDVDDIEEELKLLVEEAEKALSDDIKEYMSPGKPGASPVKVTLTPPKENGETETGDEIVTLVSGDEEGESTPQNRKNSSFWMRELEKAEKDSGEYDSEDDEEYVPPAGALDSSLDYDEYSDGEDVIPTEEVNTLIKESSVPLSPPPAYMAVWVHVGSVKDRIARAEQEQSSTEICKNIVKDLDPNDNVEIDVAKIEESERKDEDIEKNKEAVVSSNNVADQGSSEISLEENVAGVCAKNDSA